MRTESRIPNSRTNRSVCLIASSSGVRCKRGKYKGYPLRTHGSGEWLDGYSDHLPTVVYLVKEQK
jgi:hypothetical protein